MKQYRLLVGLLVGVSFIPAQAKMIHPEDLANRIEQERALAKECAGKDSQEAFDEFKAQAGQAIEALLNVLRAGSMCGDQKIYKNRKKELAKELEQLKHSLDVYWRTVGQTKKSKGS